MRSNRFFLLAFFPALAFAGDCENYCVGVRGNGEAEPAHPAALARMVEEFGMPNAMAGGSSATITMFLAEQVRKSPKATGEQDADRKRKIQARKGSRLLTKVESLFATSTESGRIKMDLEPRARGPCSNRPYLMKAVFCDSQIFMERELPGLWLPS